MVSPLLKNEIKISFKASIIEINSYILFIVGHECDLAMLQIDDVTFWEGLEPLTFGPIPDLLEDVSVIGYPVGYSTFL